MNFALSKAAVVALVLEILIVGAFVLYLEKQPEKHPQEQHVVMLSFPAPPAPPAPPKPKAEPVKKEPAPHPKPVHHERPRQERTEKPLPQPNVAEASPSPAAAPALPPAPAKPAPAAPVISATFREEVNAAVQAAMQYPYAARMTNITGKAQISFTYLDGQASHPVLVTSSGYGMLDNAAKQAVETATYPPPPRNLAGKPLTILIWVRFYLTDSE